MKEKRPLIYISHPLTGNPAGNRESARIITAYLSRDCGFNNYIFINPLDLFMGQSLSAHSDAAVLSQAIEVMRKCDGVIFCKGWQKSRGCRMEHYVAYKAGLPRWDGVETFCTGFHDRTPYEFWCKLNDAYARTWGYKDFKDYIENTVLARKEASHAVCNL